MAPRRPLTRLIDVRAFLGSGGASMLIAREMDASASLVDVAEAAAALVVVLLRLDILVTGLQKRVGALRGSESEEPDTESGIPCARRGRSRRLDLGSTVPVDKGC